jgi:LmbE family N-acetylglucosaminyl deacetylase
MNKDPLSVLAVYAHPDDEGLVTGTFARYKAEGVHIALICATRGEVGEIAPGVDATPETLGQVRELELRKAMSYPNVDEIFFLDYRDSGMVGTAENEDPRNLHNAPLDAVIGKVVRIVRQVRPQVLLTFDPKGGYGHPDHIKIHHATMAAFDKSGDPTAYPEQLTDGLAPYTPQKLYWNAFSMEFFQELARYFREQGIDTTEFGAFDPEQRGTPVEQITTKIDVRPYLKIKENAWAAHASQHNPKSIFGRAPREMFVKWQSMENMVLAESRVQRTDGIEDDIFVGIR